MYLLDPDLGRRRRSLIRDQVVGIRNDLTDFYDAAAEDLNNRARGLASRARLSPMSGESADRRLEERARMALPYVVGHPGAVEVMASGGHLIVSGPVMEYEVDPTIQRLSALPGVTSIDNRLEPHARPENIPALQGAPNRLYRREDWRSGQWSPGTRLLAGAGGGALALYGGMRGGLSGQLMRLGGVGLTLRSIFNRPLKAALRQYQAEGLVDVQKEIVVNAPAERVFELWSNLENLPKFMGHVKEVKVTGDGRSHWKAAGPAGIPVEWDAMTTARIPNREIAWRSLPGQPVTSHGQVRFMPLDANRTRVLVRMAYSPPAGVVGHAVAKLLGADPKSAMGEDMVRFKSLVETGRTTAEGREVTREEVMGGMPGGRGG